ncbi:hypothetical protein SAMN05421847_2169 [Halpernia humi]|uniref:Uncharacterized protein n=1 Tax=Halpernia humi TaxID=493375 RepID=A0A1H5ZRK2_9FLAO|nr:hypothetical protein SAMN05421847_2169 [Halpernia humi]
MIKKYRDIFLLIIVFAIAITINVNISAVFINTVYTVVGIMFSIGLGVIVTFNLQGVRNKNIIVFFRNNLLKLRNSYIKYFVITTVLFLVDNFFRESKNNIKEIQFKNISLNFDISVFVSLIMFFCILYFIYNFILLQKLNDDIYDELNK